MEFPDVDEWGTPVEKLPNCPRCDEDELGVIGGVLLCYFCQWKMWKEDSK